MRVRDDAERDGRRTTIERPERRHRTFDRQSLLGPVRVELDDARGDGLVAVRPAGLEVRQAHGMPRADRQQSVLAHLRHRVHHLAQPELHGRMARRVGHPDYGHGRFGRIDQIRPVCDEGLDVVNFEGLRLGGERCDRKAQQRQEAEAPDTVHEV